MQNFNSWFTKRRYHYKYQSSYNRLANIANVWNSDFGFSRSRINNTERWTTTWADVLVLASQVMKKEQHPS